MTSPEYSASARVAPNVGEYPGRTPQYSMTRTVVGLVAKEAHYLQPVGRVALFEKQRTRARGARIALGCSVTVQNEQRVLVGRNIEAVLQKDTRRCVLAPL
jgi:hypothetical protein